MKLKKLEKFNIIPKSRQKFCIDKDPSRDAIQIQLKSDEIVPPNRVIDVQIENYHFLCHCYNAPAASGTLPDSRWMIPRTILMAKHRQIMS